MGRFGKSIGGWCQGPIRLALYSTIQRGSDGRRGGEVTELHGGLSKEKSSKKSRAKGLEEIKERNYDCCHTHRVCRGKQSGVVVNPGFLNEASFANGTVQYMYLGRFHMRRLRRSHHLSYSKHCSSHEHSSFKQLIPYSPRLRNFAHTLQLQY